MSAPKLDDKVLAFVREAGKSVELTPDGDGLRIGETQVQLVVRQVDAVYTVEVIEQGNSNGVDLMTEERAALERYIVVHYGQMWRRAHGLDRLATTSEDLTLPPGYEVIDEGGTSTAHWAQAGRDCRASVPDGADELALTLPFTLDEVLAAFKDPHGRPVFAPPAKRFWRR